MKRYAFVICAMSVAFLLAGCGEPAAEDKFLSHWEKIVSLVSENTADAAQAAETVKQYVEDNLEEMKTLGEQFGKNAEKKISEDPAFIRRVMEVLDKINTLQEKNPELLGNAGLNQALTPLSDMMR